MELKNDPQPENWSTGFGHSRQIRILNRKTWQRVKFHISVFCLKKVRIILVPWTGSTGVVGFNGLRYRGVSFNVSRL
jgi:hypothetical protein